MEPGFSGQFLHTLPHVELTPPFSELYERDFGGATLCIALVLGTAVITPRTAIVVPATLSFSVFAIPHFYNHLHRLTGSTTFEAIALTSLNLLVAALGITIILVTSLRDQRDRRRNVTIPGAETS